MSSKELGPWPDRPYWRIADESTGCVELPQLDLEGIDYSDRLVAMLFDPRSEPLEMRLRPYLDHIFRNYHFASINARQRKGRHLFGVGFPLFLFWSDTGWKSFPLFIARMQLQSRQEGLFIARDRDGDLEPNPYLLGYLREQFGKDYWKTCKALLAKPFVHEKDLNKTIQQISGQTGMALWSKEHSWAPLPEPGQLEPYQESGVIVKTGYLGLFEPLLTRREVKSTSEVPPEQGSGTEGHPFGLLSLDPFQEKVYRAIRQGGECTVVEGPKGSGKTHLMVQLISNALANGKNCLVLSNYLAPLKEVSSKLAHFDLRAVSFLYQKQPQDDGLLLELLRSVLEQAPRSNPAPDNDQFGQHLDKIIRARRNLDDQYQLVRTPLINGWNWTELVGRFYRFNRREGREKLAMQLNPQHFEFNSKEYNLLIRDVEEGAALIDRVEKPDSSLAELHPRLFLTGNKEDNGREVERRLSFNLAKGKKLLDQYASEQSRYAEALYLHYDGLLANLDDLIRRFRELHAEARNRFGERLFRKGGMSGLFSAFSANAKRLKEERNKLSRAYHSLAKHFGKDPFFDFDFPPVTDIQGLAKTGTTVDRFANALDEWRLDLNKVIRDDLGRLSTKTALGGLGFNRRLEELEYDLELFVRHLNEEQLVSEEFSHQMLILPQQQQFLETLVSRLERLYRAAPEFVDFYDWQRFWIKLSDQSRLVVKALSKSRAESWVEAFESWYTNQCLIKFNRPGLPQYSLDLPEYCAQSYKFKDILRRRIVELLGQARWQCADRLRKKNRLFYNTLVQRKNDRPADSVKLLREHFEEVVACIPVLFSTPVNISAIIDRNGFEFDYVLVEGGQTLWKQEIEALKKWGKQVVVLAEGSPADLPSGEELPDGLSYLKTQPDTLCFRLRNIHQWQPGNLPALQQGQLLYPRDSQEVDIDYIQLEARYDEQQRINEEEAQLVLRLLNDIRETPQRTYPKVGIVCLTEGQRNLIMGYLHRIKQQDLPGSDKIRQLERNGLGISTPGDLVGTGYDILIVSVTYGEIDLKGNITAHLSELDNQFFVHTFQGLLSAGGTRIQVVSSLPPGMLENFAMDLPLHSGRRLLAYYLLYLKSLSADTPSRTDTERLVKDFSASRKPSGQGPSYFEEEVVRTLQPFLPTQAAGPDPDRGYGLQSKYILPDSQPEKAHFYLLTEGFFSTSEVIDYDWDYRRIKHLERIGYEAIPVWSANWWKNRDGELKRLTRLIRQKVFSEEDQSPELGP